MKYASIPDFPGYRVGTSGVAQSCWKFRGGGYAGQPEWYQSRVWKTLKPDPDKRGRKRVTLSRNGKTYKMRVSRLVLTAFIGPCPEGLEACHDNGDESDDRLSNLRWDTHSANMLDKRKHGTATCNAGDFSVKLSESAVRDIRTAGYPLKSTAMKYGLSVTMISMILRRKVYQHVE